MAAQGLNGAVNALGQTLLVVIARCKRKDLGVNDEPATRVVAGNTGLRRSRSTRRVVASSVNDAVAAVVEFVKERAGLLGRVEKQLLVDCRVANLEGRWCQQR